MAKTKEEKMAEAVNTKNEIKAESESVVENVKEVEKPVEAKQNGPTYDELMSIVQSLAREVQELKAAKPTIQTTPIADNSSTERLIELLANRKSDKEVDIVHNREMLNGLSTHIELSNVTIDFHAMGEHRLLSWQQFEECVSKYRSFFEQKIIVIGAEHKDIAERYNIPFVKSDNYAVMTHEDIVKLPSLSVEKLRNYVMSLSKEDQNFVYSYWLGKCYNRVNGFYDRSKIETLNAISGEKVFDNLLALMNGDYRNNE